MESQPLQQTAPAMTVDFDAVFGNKTTASNNGTHPAAGKALTTLRLTVRTEKKTKNTKKKTLFFVGFR